MPLINCPDCNKEISDQSTSCIHCGRPIKTNKYDPLSTPYVSSSNYEPKNEGIDIISILAKFFVVLIGVVMVYMCVSVPSNDGSNANSAQSNYSTPDIETTASRMINTYQENEVRADAIYKNKVIKMTGIVSSISSDITNEAVINFAPNGDELSFNTLMASGDNDFHNKAVNLKKGQKVTLICLGDGEVIGSPLLKDCKFS